MTFRHFCFKHRLSYKVAYGVARALWGSLANCPFVERIGNNGIISYNIIDEDSLLSALKDYKSNRYRFRIDLTEAEIEVCKCLAEGIGNYNEIAAKLFVTRSTIATHITSAFQKLNVTSKIGLLVRAIQLGYVKIERIKKDEFHSL